MTFYRCLGQFCRQLLIERKILHWKYNFGYFFGAFGAWSIKIKQTVQKKLEKFIEGATLAF